MDKDSIKDVANKLLNMGLIDQDILHSFLVFSESHQNIDGDLIDEVKGLLSSFTPFLLHRPDTEEIIVLSIIENVLNKHGENELATKVDSTLKKYIQWVCSSFEDPENPFPFDRQKKEFFDLTDREDKAKILDKFLK